MEKKYKMNNIIDQYNAEIKKFVDNETVFYIDINDYVDFENQLHGDGYHLNKVGNKNIYNRLNTLLKKIGQKNIKENKYFNIDYFNLIEENNYLIQLLNKNDYNSVLKYNFKNKYNYYFYVGKYYKTIHDYKNGEILLNKYIDGYEKMIDRIKSDINFPFDNVLNEQRVISSFFHLGELYLNQNKYKQAKVCFEKCMCLTNNNHKKAEEYLTKL